MAELEEEIQCDHCKKMVSSSNYQIHEIRCQRFMTVCTLCDDTVPKDQIDRHNEELHAQVLCDQCDDQMAKDLLDQHKVDNCPRRLLLCTYCDLNYPHCELKLHQEICGSRTDKCDFCSATVMLSNMIKHKDSSCTGYTTSSSAPPDATTDDHMNTSLGTRAHLGRPTNQRSHQPLLPKINNPDRNTRNRQDSSQQLSAHLARDLRPVKLPVGQHRMKSFNPSEPRRTAQTDSSHSTRPSATTRQTPPGLRTAYQSTGPTFTARLTPPNRSDSPVMVPCEFCDQKLSFDDLGMHQAMCDMNPIIRYEQLNLHKEDNRSPSPVFHSRTTQAEQHSILTDSIPCEFCDAMIPIDSLTHHQDGCTENPVLPYNEGMFVAASPLVQAPLLGQVIKCECCGMEYDSSEQAMHQIECPAALTFEDQPLVNRPEYFYAGANHSRTCFNTNRKNTPPISGDESQSREPIVSFPDEVIPCEFCHMTFPIELLVQHQHVCEENNVRMVTPLPSVNPATRYDKWPTGTPERRLFNPGDDQSRRACPRSNQARGGRRVRRTDKP